MSSNSCVILVMNYQTNDLCCVLPVENGTVLFLNVDPPLVFPVSIYSPQSFEVNLKTALFFFLRKRFFLNERFHVSKV